MTKDEIVGYADAVASVTRARGEISRAKAIEMLHALDLTDDQATEVIAHGLAHGFFTENPIEASLLAKKGRSLADIERESEILRAIQASAPICIWAIDRQGVYTHCAGKVLASIGIKEGQLVGQNLFEINDVSEVNEAARKACAGEMSSTTVEYSDIVWETWYLPCRDEHGEIQMVTGFALDVSSRKRTEIELREQLKLIERQRQVISELSTPIIEVWDKVLTLPILGMIDGTRATKVMDALLTRVSQGGARFAILDLTAIDTMDTGTAAHLLKLIHALRLLGAVGIITGIQPVVAQTMVALGLDLETIVTCASLRRGLQFCMEQMRRPTA